MKKILFFICFVFCLTSCVVCQYTTGDISLYNTDGKVIRQWNNSYLEYQESYGNNKINKYAIKEGGFLNFTDEFGETHLIGGGIIIIDNIAKSGYKNQEKSNNDIIIRQYKAIRNEILELQKKQKDLDENSAEYKNNEERLYNLFKKKIDYEEWFKEILSNN